MKTKAILLVVAAAFVSACSGIKVSSDYDPAADFNVLKTYAWLPGPKEKTGDPRIDNPLLTGRIESAVDNNLGSRGYNKVSADKADFFVTFHLGIDQKINVTEIPSTWGYAGRWGGVYSTETRVDQYDEGTLMIDVIDAEKDDLLWRGSGQARVRDSKSPEERQERIQKTVDAVLEKFPPR